jgi:N-methylhydantoinase B
MANGVPHAAGEAFEYVYGGGGGWGDPLDRDPQRVLDDVLDEYVSREAAEREYGVVFTGELLRYDLAVDAAATQRLRARLREEGSGREERSGAGA